MYVLVLMAWAVWGFSLGIGPFNREKKSRMLWSAVLLLTLGHVTGWYKLA